MEKLLADYLASRHETGQHALQKLRQSLLRLYPQAEEQLYKQIPTFIYRGKPLLSYAAFTHHYSVYVISKRIIRLLAPDITSFQTEDVIIRFSYNQQAPPGLLKKIVAERKKEIDRKTVKKKILMEKYELQEDLHLLCERASSFPADIMGAHQRLHGKITPGQERKYYGLSRPDSDGSINYYAAVEELESDDAKKAGLEALTLKKGLYLSIQVPNYMEKPAAIGEAFRQLIAGPDIDPQGWCLEWYESKNDVRCMVRLKD